MAMSTQLRIRRIYPVHRRFYSFQQAGHIRGMDISNVSDAKCILVCYLSRIDDKAFFFEQVIELFEFIARIQWAMKCRYDGGLETV